MTTETAPRRRRPRRPAGPRRVYEPHTSGLPPLGPYVRDLWRRREFGIELSRTNLRARHANTAFGLLWLVLNPLLLASVYFILVDILRGGSRGSAFFAHLVGGIFAYYFVSQSAQQAVKSVTSGGRLILNTAFPRALLPLASVLTAFLRFLPTLAVYAVLHVALGMPVGPEVLWVVPIIAILVVLASGLAMLVAATQVYFRDLKEFLPYVLRVWLYATPILYFADEVPERYQWLLAANPLGPTLTAWSDALIEGRSPAAGTLLLGLGWALAIFVAGALVFVSREREFAVRL
jgi:teichoic acid transport system permease protein